MDGDHMSVEEVNVKVEPAWEDSEGHSVALQCAWYIEHDIKQEQVTIADVQQTPFHHVTIHANHQIKYETEATVYAEHEIKLEPDVISEAPQSPVPQATVNGEFEQEAGINLELKQMPIITDIKTVPQAVYVEQEVTQKPVVIPEAQQAGIVTDNDTSTTNGETPAPPPPAKPKRKGSKKRKLHYCEICQKPFTHFSNVQKHLLIHTGLKPYACDICKKEFRQLINLKTHKTIHTGIKPHTCKICNREFRQLVNLRSHELTHTGVKPHSCDVCQKKFTRLDTLKTHKRIHSGEKPHSCDICKKEFIKSCDLKIHKRIHTGQRPYACDECELRFTQKGNLIRHKAVIHAKNSSAVTETTDSVSKRIAVKKRGEQNSCHPYPCDECELRFTQKSNLIRHKIIHARNSTITETTDKVSKAKEAKRTAGRLTHSDMV